MVCVRPTSSKVQEAGPSHGLGGGVRLLRAAFEVAGRLLGVLGMRALSRPAIRHFENSTAGEVSPVCCFDFGLAPEYAFWLFDFGLFGLFDFGLVQE